MRLAFYRMLPYALVLGLIAVSAASFYGWGVDSDAKAVAKSVRQGSMGRRGHYGGYRYGK